MKLIKVAFLLIFAMQPFVASAQFSISKVKPKEMITKEGIDSIKRETHYNNKFFSQAKWDAERKALRKQRNKLEFNPSLQITQTQFDNWAPGGNNTFTGRAAIHFRHEYRRDRLAFTYRADARYGVNVIDDKAFKNEDEFQFNLMTSWNFQRSWSYAATFNIRSQFTNGYKSRDEKVLKSAFMAPGFIDISVGFNFNNNKSPFNITISPIAGSVTTVLKPELSEQGINNVPKGRKSNTQLGPSVRMNFDKEFCKKIFRFRSNLYSFTNIKTTPTVRWENWFDIRATKFFTTTVYALGYYDKYAITPKPTKMQYNYSFGVGLSYQFKNK